MRNVVTAGAKAVDVTCPYPTKDKVTDIYAY
jgi:hypothetical protein